MEGVVDSFELAFALQGRKSQNRPDRLGKTNRQANPERKPRKRYGIGEKDGTKTVKLAYWPVVSEAGCAIFQGVGWAVGIPRKYSLMLAKKCMESDQPVRGP